MSTLLQTRELSVLPRTAPSISRAPSFVVAVAWAVMLGSMVAPIFWGLTQAPPTAFTYSIVAGSLVLGTLLVTIWWQAGQVLRGYLLAFGAATIGAGAVAAIVVLAQQNGYREWAMNLPAAAQPPFTPQYGPVLFRLVTLALVVLTLIGSTLGRRELFLSVGDLRARVQGLGRLPRATPWWLVGGVFLLVLSAGTAAFMAIATGVGPDSPKLARLPLAVPFILVAAATNAFIEEFVFRSVMLARLIPILGARQANWLQTVLFGLSHFFGTPSGPLGVLMSGFLGWLNGKSMLETRGFTIAFLLHFAQDAVIFAFFVMSLP